ncbi:MAG: hypothetical protein WD934_06135 [Gemmatimonadales bacterium]
MSRFFGVLLVLGVTGLVAHPTPADAQGSDTEHRLVKCMLSAMSQCDEWYPGDGFLTRAARGWCYISMTATCD